jgi:hypothetical protein
MWSMSCCPFQGTRVQPVFSGARVARSCLCTVLIFCPFTFGHYFVCHSSSIYPFGIFKLFVSRGHEQVNTEMYIWCLEPQNNLKPRNAHLVSRTLEQVKYINVHLVSGTPEEVKYINVYLVFIEPLNKLYT